MLLIALPLGKIRISNLIQLNARISKPTAGFLISSDQLDQIVQIRTLYGTNFAQSGEPNGSTN